MSKSAYRYNQSTSHTPTIQEEIDLMVEGALNEYDEEANYLINAQAEADDRLCAEVNELERHYKTVSDLHDWVNSPKLKAMARDHMAMLAQKIREALEIQSLYANSYWADMTNLECRRNEEEGRLYALLRGEPVPAPLPDPFYRNRAF